MNEKLRNMIYNTSLGRSHGNAVMLNELSSESLVYASDEEEFFYEDEDVAVSEGDPIGFDIEINDEVKLILFKNIYWKVDDYE